MQALILSKKWRGHFFEKAAPCCAQNLFAYCEQIPHLQGEKCFQPRTRRGRKQISYLLRLRARLRSRWQLCCLTDAAYPLRVNSARLFRYAESLHPMDAGSRCCFRTFWGSQADRQAEYAFPMGEGACIGGRDQALAFLPERAFWNQFLPSTNRETM